MGRLDTLRRTVLAAACLLLGGAVEAQEAAAGAFDHSHAAWDGLLRAHVHDGGLVDYPGLAERRAELDGYLAALEAVSAADFAAWEPTQREAFWINAYNAYTVQLILDHYPVKSIRSLGGLFSSVFDKRFVPLQHLVPAEPLAKASTKKKLSLGELEHGILGRTARLPLFHFAIVCASWSCPELRPEAYVPARLDEQLGEQARAFLADGTKNDQRIEKGRLRVSKIFDWSEDELEGYPGGIRKLLADYGPATLVDDPALAAVKLRYRKYDWSLNLWKPEKDSGT